MLCTAIRVPFAMSVAVALFSAVTRGQGIDANSEGDVRSELTLVRSLIERQQERLKSAELELDRLKGLLITLEQRLRIQEPATRQLGNAPLQPAAQSNLSEPDSKQISSVPAPPALRLGNLFFRPVGFAELTSYFRSTNVGSGSGTTFGTIPFKTSVPGQLSETRLSAQNSRIGARVDAQPFGTRLIGYVEADFVGAQVLDAIVTRSSSPLNLRLFFATVQRSKWEITAGQAWSLLTPNRRGLSPLPADIFYTLNLDTNYQVGLVWSRTPQLRVVYQPARGVHIGGSLENSSQYVGPYVVFPTSTDIGYYGQLDTGSLSAAVPALTPDVVAKVAVDRAPWGRQLHFEVGALIRTFKVSHPVFGRIETRPGLGVAANVDFELFRGFHLIANNYVSSGGGRQISGLAPDVVVRGDGSLSTVKAHSTLDGFEYRASPKVVLFGYYGGVYTKRNVSSYQGQTIGFGVLGSEAGGIFGPTVGLTGPYAAANRSIQEATAGLSHTIWSHPTYGSMQWNTQFSYVKRRAWATSLDADTTMAFVTLRYLLP